MISKNNVLQDDAFFMQMQDRFNSGSYMEVSEMIQTITPSTLDGWIERWQSQGLCYFLSRQYNCALGLCLLSELLSENVDLQRLNVIIQSYFNLQLYNKSLFYIDSYNNYKHLSKDKSRDAEILEIERILRIKL